MGVELQGLTKTPPVLQESEDDDEEEEEEEDDDEDEDDDDDNGDSSEEGGDSSESSSEEESEDGDEVRPWHTGRAPGGLPSPSSGLGDTQIDPRRPRDTEGHGEEEEEEGSRIPLVWGPWGTGRSSLQGPIEVYGRGVQSPPKLSREKKSPVFFLVEILSLVSAPFAPVRMPSKSPESKLCTGATEL